MSTASHLFMNYLNLGFLGVRSRRLGNRPSSASETTRPTHSTFSRRQCNLTTPCSNNIEFWNVVSTCPETFVSTCPETFQTTHSETTRPSTLKQYVSPKIDCHSIFEFHRIPQASNHPKVNCHLIFEFHRIPRASIDCYWLNIMYRTGTVLLVVLTTYA